jgi:acetyl esterase/lipase
LSTKPFRLSSLDPEVQLLLDDLHASGAPTIAASTPPEVRARVAQMRETMPPGPQVAAVVDLQIPGADDLIPARRYRAGADPPYGVVLYLHGGGWVCGGIEESDALCRALVLASGCDVLSVGYRLAPEHPFPAAVRDADAALAWLLEVGAPTSSVVLLGESAGANLAAVVALHVRDHTAAARVVLQVLVYPVTDHAMDTRSYSENVEGLLLNAPDMRWFWDHYAPDPQARRSPDASPLRAPDLACVAPAFIVVTEFDPLRDEGLAYARSLVEAGVEVTLDDYAGMIHGFFPLVGVLAAAGRAVETIGTAIAAAVSRAEPVQAVRDASGGVPGGPLA